MHERFKINYGAQLNVLEGGKVARETQPRPGILQVVCVIIGRLISAGTGIAGINSEVFNINKFNII